MSVYNICRSLGVAFVLTKGHQQVNNESRILVPLWAEQYIEMSRVLWFAL